MLRIRKLLLKDIIYYLIFLISIIYFLISINIETKTQYKEFNNEEFTIYNITKTDYGIKLDLKGKEKVIGYIYKEENEIIKEYNKYNLNDKVRITGEIKNIKNNTTENTFNYKKYLYNQKIYNTIEITKINIIKNNKNIFYKIKTFLIKRTNKLEKSYAYINSLILGNNKYLDKEVNTSYQNNGISHLFAISGSHINILIVIIYFILKKLKLKENKRYIITILFLLLYMFITNFQMSVIRSCIFAILLIINKIYYFNIKSINLLLLTMTIIIFINPLFLYNIGLQFSALISAFLIIYSDLINKRKTFIGKLIMTSSISFIVSYPIVINNFYQVNFLSILYNIFFVPYMSFILLPLTLISYIFPFLDNILYFFITINEFISLFVNRFTLSIGYMCKLSMSIIVVYFVLVIFTLNKLKKGRKIYIMLLIFFYIINMILPISQKDEIIFFDVDQGDSILLKVDNTINLIDTGGIVMYNDKEYTYTLSKNRILPYVKSTGIKKIDNLILTHGDADHMLESIYIIENFNVKNIYINCNSTNYLEKKLIKIAKNKNIKVQKLCKNDKIKLNKTTLYSLNNKRNNENDSSIVLYTKINKYKILLTGDISQKIEKEIIEEYSLNNLYILKLAHHGSKTSSNYNFLKTTNPKYSIISAGLDNKFNHPSQETITNLEKLNLKYLETSKLGSIKFNLKNGTYTTSSP